MPLDVTNPNEIFQPEHQSASSLSFSDVMSRGRQSDSMLKQVQDGIVDSATDWQGQLRRGAATGAFGYWIGGELEYARFGPVASRVAFAAAAITALDHLTFSKSHNDFAKQHNDGALEGVTKFGADVLSATGVGLLLGRMNWVKTADEHIESIINTKFDSRYVSAYRGGRGPKRFNVPAHTRYSEAPLDKKLDRLEDLLKSRGQMDRFKPLSERVQSAHEEMWKKPAEAAE